MSDDELRTWITRKGFKLESGGEYMLKEITQEEFDADPSRWIGSGIPPALLTADGIKLDSGEWITEGRVLDTARKAVKLLDAGDKIGFYEMMNIDRYEEEGWSEYELYVLVGTYLEDGRSLCCEVTDIMDTEEFDVYWESKNNS